MGRLVAQLLGAGFTDLDREIERDAGSAISAIFARQGEAAFRRLEREAMAGALDAPAAVISAGGGWAAQPGNMEAVANRVFILYLYIDPETAAERVGKSGDRPLLQDDPHTAMTALFTARDAAYRQSHAVVDTGGKTPQEVASEVAALARNEGGW